MIFMCLNQLVMTITFSLKRNVAQLLPRSIERILVAWILYFLSIYCIHRDLLSSCFALCSLASSYMLFLPNNFMSVILSPIFKKGCAIIRFNSYSSIALGHYISKVYDILILNTLFHHLDTTDNQFGYKCLFVFKEIIDNYTHRYSNIYCCFFRCK